MYPVVNDNTTSNSPTFTSAPANALTSQPGWPSMVVGYPQPYPPADAPFHYPPPSIDTNFLLPAQQQAGSFSSALEGPLDLDLDFMTPPPSAMPGNAPFDLYRLDFDLDNLQTRPSSPSASSTFSTPSLTWSESSLSSSSSFGLAISQPGSGYSSPGYSSPTANSDVESICLPPALLTIQPSAQSTTSSALPSARSSPDPVPQVAAPQPQKGQIVVKKEASDVEESREKEKRTTVGKIKAKIFGSNGRSDRKSKSDGYTKKRDPRREKAYKCPVSIRRAILRFSTR